MNESDVELIVQGDYVKDKSLKDIKIVESIDENGIILRDIDGTGRTFYSSQLIETVLKQYEIYIPKSVKEAVAMIDTYKEAPQMYWYTTDTKIYFDTYMIVYRCGVRCVGFLVEPEQNIINRYDLKYIGKGDFSWLKFKEIEH